MVGFFLFVLRIVAPVTDPFCAFLFVALEFIVVVSPSLLFPQQKNDKKRQTPEQV